MSDDAEIIHLPTTAAVSRDRHPTTQARRVDADGIRQLREILGNVLEPQREFLRAAGDYESLARGWQDVKGLLDDLATFARSIELDVAAILDERHTGKGRPAVEVEGVGVIEVRGGSTRSGWKSNDLLNELVADALIENKAIDPDTGEVLERTAYNTVADLVDVLRKALPLTASTGWRITALRELGIDPDDWSESRPVPRRASIPKRKMTTPEEAHD